MAPKGPASNGMASNGTASDGTASNGTASDGSVVNSRAYMTRQGVANLASYKYKSADYTPLDNLLNPFWLGASRRVPASVSPNMVTLIGFVFAVSGMMAQVFKLFLPESYAWTGLGEDELRLAVNLYTAFSIFMYQTLDAVDGKHARATRQSTPLGALFDHGIDGAVMCIMGIIMNLVMWGDEESNSQLSPGMLTIGGGAGFFFSQWGHYHTGTLQTVGITEVQYFTILVIILIGVFQTSLLSQTAPDLLQIPGFFKTCFLKDSCHKAPSSISDQLLPFTVDFSEQSSLPLISAHFVDFKGMFCYFTSLLPVTFVVSSVFKVVFPSEGEKPVGEYAYEKLGRPLATILPYLCHAALSFALILFCPQLWRKHPLMIITVIGTGTVYLNLRIIVSGLCSLRFPSLIKTSQPFTAFALGAVLTENPRSKSWLSQMTGLFGAGLSESRISNSVGILYSEYSQQALVSMLMFQLFAIFRFAAEVISVICRELKIPFLAPLSEPYSPRKKNA